ncbi:hypothetical protein GCM10010532_098540 [Dactylosporangium siamense]|uniref:Uncharacterized protein n=1 Tax=Dactylosporangium siamense TaxID=685454 RepID=A0A919UDV6_9ACTN|nr:hypothetical protein Dsi01nite_063820 [Dactylosporangium siamense]
MIFPSLTFVPISVLIGTPDSPAAGVTASPTTGGGGAVHFAAVCFFELWHADRPSCVPNASATSATAFRLGRLMFSACAWTWGHRRARPSEAGPGNG